MASSSSQIITPVVPNAESDEAKIESPAESFNYDRILEEHLGPLGRFQRRIFLWLCIPALAPGIVILSFTFTGGVPNYRCFIPRCDVKSDDSLDFVPKWFNNIPVSWNISDFLQSTKCYRNNQTWKTQAQCARNIMRNPYQVERCDQWIYDKSVFTSTIVTEFMIACENEWKETLINSLFMVGMLIGAFTVGNLGDIIGRRLTFTVNAFVMACVMTGSAFSPNVVSFGILRFFCGVTASGHFLILFVWGVESVGKSYRIIVGFVFQMMFTLGSAILGLVAYFVREWRTLQLIISLPLFLLISFHWILPESTRWLIVKNRYAEARQLILKAGEMNGKLVPEHLIVIEDVNEKEEKIDSKAVPKLPTAAKNETILDIFRSTILLRRLIIMFFAWIAGVMCYYGITYSASNLSGNFYLNYELSILIEFPAYIAGIISMDKLGRRATLSGGLLISGFSCLVTGLLPQNLSVTRTVFSLLGKLFISCVLAIVYSYTSDLFPTPVRTTIVGMCSMMGRFGGIMAPVIANTGRTADPSLPYIIFASSSIAVGLLCFLLPETRNSPLPSNTQEAIDAERNSLLLGQCPCYKNNKVSSSSNDQPTMN